MKNVKNEEKKTENSKEIPFSTGDSEMDEWSSSCLDTFVKNFTALGSYWCSITNFEGAHIFKIEIIFLL